MKKLDAILHKLVHEGLDDAVQPHTDSSESASWKEVRHTGTRLWLDTGDLAAARSIWDSGFEALTTNNTLLSREVEQGGYDGFIERAAQRIREEVPTIGKRTQIHEINLALSARHGLILARTFNTRVSVELHTDLANEVDISVDSGKRLFALCPEHFIVKVPYTPAGLLAARQLGQAEVPVNLTLGFSARQAYLAARLANPRYVNVFLGRLNSYVEESGLGAGDGVGEKTTWATQKVISALREGGQAESQLIAASMRSAEQVAILAGVDVLTMPPAVAKEYQKHPPPSLEARKMAAGDLRISMQPGYTTADFNGASLWNLEEPVHRAITDLMAMDVDAMTPDDLTGHFAKEAVEEFMPTWSLDEIDVVLDGGKIPSHEVWGDRLRNGSLGLDALMNIAALGAFVMDQKKLDDRINGFL
jgi:transaldolase